MLVSDSRHGILSATGAFLLWGLLPVFWKQLSFMPPVSIIAHRTIWSVAVLFPLVMLCGRWKEMRTVICSPGRFAWHLLSGLLLGSNWLLYVWATLNGRILEGALGYYLNPFLNMLFGTLLFRERHNRAQLVAILVAACGVVLQFPALRGLPWVSLVLALTFALYAVVRKLSPAGALTGLTTETLLLAPLACAWLVVTESSWSAAFGGSPVRALLICATGLATATPLLLFSHATRTIRLTTLGILQFLSPTMQFVIGAFLYHEPLPLARVLSFALVWLAVGIYALDMLRGLRPTQGG